MGNRVENKPLNVAIELAKVLDEKNPIGVFYATEGNSNKWTWYVNAPDWKTAITDVFAEMPHNAEIYPTTINTYIVTTGDGGYFRKWKVIRLDRVS